LAGRGLKWSNDCRLAIGLAICGRQGVLEVDRVWVIVAVHGPMAPPTCKLVAPPRQPALQDRDRAGQAGGKFGGLDARGVGGAVAGVVGGVVAGVVGAAELGVVDGVGVGVLGGVETGVGVAV
jgi:hypothetical protein